MLSLLVFHTRYRNSHKFLIDLLTIHMIQYSSGYDARFPRKRSWFDSQLGNNIYFCCCCFLFAFVVFILIFFLFLSSTVLTIRQLLHLGKKSHKALDILYLVQKFSLLSVAWFTGAQLIIFFCFRFSVVLVDRPGISIRHAAHCVCRVLVFASS